jgi:hypothetical protein
MQILGILRLFALDQSGGICNHLIQINTGEGKSIALGFTAVILAALGFSVDVVCYSRYLCERDQKEFAALFELLDQQAFISYNDFNIMACFPARSCKMAFICLIFVPLSEVSFKANRGNALALPLVMERTRTTMICTHF